MIERTFHLIDRFNMTLISKDILGLHYMMIVAVEVKVTQFHVSA